MAETLNAKPMKVGEVAKQLNVTPSTIRNWCRRYAEFLSESANPAHGGERLFNTRDVNVLTYIHAAMNDGVNHPEIVVRLGEKTFNAQSVDIVVGEGEEMSTEAALSPTDAPGNALMLPMVLTAIDKRLEAVERDSARLVALEQRLEEQARRIEEQAREARSRQLSSLTLLAAGVIIGIVIVVALSLVVQGMQPLW